MIFVDTSVWVEALRGEPKTSHALNRELDNGNVALAAPVRVELLAGAGRHTIARLERVLRALPIFFPTRDTWRLVETWAIAAAMKGERFGVGDLLVGAVATERGGQVWSLDADFRRMQRLKLLRLH